MSDLRKEYIGMLVRTAEKKYAGKKAFDPAAGFFALDTASRVGGGALGVAGAAAKGVASVAVPIACMYLFGKYLAIPAFAGYMLGNSYARSTSPSDNDLEAAENNALAKETERRTEALKSMPAVTPQSRDKDMMTRRSDTSSFGEAF